jgi:predicted TIM-barrel fold metal-dependent hydrolase
MSELVANDSRLMGAAVVPLNNPELALVELESALEADLEAV